MDYIISIPSYKRSKICNDKTLSCLYKFGIKREKVFVFVVKDEYDDYVNALNSNLYNKIIIGKEGLIQQRMFIENYFDLGTKIVSLDDDIDEIDLSLTKFKTLDEFFIHAFSECEAQNTKIWGVYPVYNKFFRETKKEVISGLIFLIGAFYGYINTHFYSGRDLLLNSRNDNKEDVERSILYYLEYGKVIRFNKIGFKTKYYGNDGGGLGKLKDRIQIMKQNAELIHNKYPEITKLKVRKNGLYEIVFPKKLILKN